MSRTRNFVHAIWSGYVLTLVVSGVALATIPIAWATIGKSAYGLWCAVVQVTAFTSIFDMGIGPSLARFLADFKDQHDSGEYANFLKSVLFLGLAQGGLFCLAALVLIPFLPNLMGIIEQQHQFQVLVLLQAVPIALGFPLRPLAQLLYANQRIAILNGCAIAANLVNAAVLVSGLCFGWGIYSYIAGAWSSFLVLNGSLFYFNRKLRLFPDLRHATISVKSLKPLAAFSGNVFLTSLGTQLINFAPGVLITRKLGVMALADWNVGTRLVMFASQLIGRIPNSSEPVFWEMFTRQDFSRIKLRLVEMLVVTGSASALFAAGILAINPATFQILTHSRGNWLPLTDVFLVLWLVTYMTTIALNMTPGMTKHVGAMKYVYVLQGACLVGLAYLPFVVLKSLWMVALLLLAFELTFRFPYGFYRTHKDLGISIQALAQALIRNAIVLLVLLMLALLLRTATSTMSALFQVLLNSAIYTLIALPLVYLIGLPSGPRMRIQQAIKRRLLGNR